jgi:hypothetical protein
VDLERESRELFERTRNAMGYRSPEWSELHDDTREMYREEVRKRAHNGEEEKHG